MASFASAAEMAFVVDELQKVVPFGQFLIGLDDQAVEGAFRWDDGECVTFTAWNSGEPNDSGNEDQVVMSVLPGGTIWSDVNANGGSFRALIEIRNCAEIGALGFETLTAGCGAFPVQPALGGQPLVATMNTPISAGVLDYAIAGMAT